MAPPSWIDLLFGGRPGVIGTGVLRGPGGAVLVDPGPTASLPTLELGLQRQGLQFSDVSHILLTHIHLDHAGATGSIVRRHPRMTVLVHESGAPHMVSPSRLIESATRLFGAAVMESFGDMVAVPLANLQPLRGGERVSVAGADIDVAHTPGHASHHVSYFDRSSGVAFVGDAAGVCLDGGDVVAPTPPPDIDVEGWHESVARIRAWMPRVLYLTHFGEVEAVEEHLDALSRNLSAQARVVRDLLAAPGTDAERVQGFAAYMRSTLARRMSEAQVQAYESVVPWRVLWLGLARYWSKRGVGEGAAARRVGAAVKHG